MVINELTLLIAIPLIIGIVNIFIPTLLRKILTLLGLVSLLFLNYQLMVKPVQQLYLFDSLVLTADQLALFTVAFVQILSFIIFIFALKGIAKPIENKFLILYPLTIAFCNGAVLSVHMIGLLLFWGLSGVMLYLFGVLGQTSEAPKSAKKTFLIVGGSDVLLILGLVLLRFLEYSRGWVLWNRQMLIEGELAAIAFICLLIAAFAKAGGFPFHTWVPDFSKDAPVESAAFLPASLDKLLGIYLLARIVISLFVIGTVLHLIIITLGALSVITAVMMALIQHNGRRLLGYHAVSQVGYMIMGVGCGSMLYANGQVIAGGVIAFSGGLFHLINNTIYKSNLFLCLGAVEKQTGTNELDELGGLGNLMPVTFITALIAALSISGIPPFNGFYSKWMIYQGIVGVTKALSPGYQIWLLICLILAIFGSALTLASFLKFLHAIFLGKRPKALDHLNPVPINQQIATALLSIFCILFGLFALQIPLKQFIYPIAQEQNWAIPEFLGSYQPLQLILLFGIAFLLGFIIYLLTRKVRQDEIYLGGMEALEKFRITGVQFYKEIKEMPPFATLYKSAEKKYFDLYDLTKKCSLGFGKFFSALHIGQLQLYSLWIILGILILIWVIR